MRRRWELPALRRPRLRTVLLLVNLLILALPLAGIWFLRLYESALIRQTEDELMAQAAVLGGAFKVERARLQGPTPASPPPPEGAAMPAGPRGPGLDLATDPILPPPPDPVPATVPAAALAVATGDALLPVLREAQRITLASIRLVDPAGVIVATTGDDRGESLAGRDEVDRALKGELVSVMRWRETPARMISIELNRGARLRVFVAMPVISGDHIVGAVMLSRTPRDLGQAIYGKRGPLVALALALLAAGLLLALVASRVITRPLAQVVEQTTRAAAGAAGAVTPLAHPGTREAAELSASVARLAMILERRADYIRSFAAHVSHEFKTPLAGAKGALELLDDHGPSMSEAERRHFQGVIAASLDRLERTVRRLLDLARADMVLPLADARTSIAAALGRLRERYEARGLEIDVRAVDATVALPPEVVDILLASLLDNVEQHAGPGAHVAIDVTAAEDRVIVSLADNGPGIPPDIAAHIFDAFFTTARDAGGTGLGLSVARAIATGAGGSIDLVPGAARGAIFRIELPMAFRGASASPVAQPPSPFPLPPMGGEG